MKRSQKILANLLLTSATLTCAIACFSSCGHTHSYTETVTAPTCTEDGFTTFTCECGDSYTDVPVEMLGHTESNWIVDKQATYEETGSQHKECTVCHEVLQNEDIPVLEKPASEGLSYTLSNDENYYIVSGIGACEDTDIVIPSTYEGKPVREIGTRAFSNHTSLTSVIIPNSVISIGERAFDDCDSLTSVEIPDSVTSIGQGAFSNCTSLTNVEIPDSVTFIDSYAFGACSSLTSVVIPDSVTSIGGWAFAYCDGLTSVEIPDSITSIGDSAFYYCNQLQFAEYGNCRYLGNENNPYLALIDVVSRNYNSYTIHEDTKLIAVYALDRCNQMTSIAIPDSVTSIGDVAFYYCTSLTNVEISDSVTSIGSWAFANCSSLTSVEISENVTSIGNSAFLDCDSLTSIIIDENNRYYKSIDGNLYTQDGKTLIQYAIGKTATSFTIPEGVTSIASYAFSYCANLTSVVIPDSVETIGSDAFKYCTNLTSVVIGDSVTSIGSGAFYNCSNLTSVVIPDNVTSIGGYAFKYCTSLTSVVIGDSVTSIEHDAFSCCANLTSVVIPDSVTSIGNSAFDSCNSLTSVVIGDSVTSIGNRTFSGCTSLTSITVSAENANYKSVDGNLYTKDGTTLIQYAIGKTATSFTIPDSVTSIGEYAFYKCSSLTSVVIGDSVTSIGNSAFSNCTSLTSVYYTGTAEKWAKISIDNFLGYNNSLINATRYYYSESQPTTSGNYWHYDENGNVIVWA